MNFMTAEMSEKIKGLSCLFDKKKKFAEGKPTTMSFQTSVVMHLSVI
jgi:hypothetical protein